MGLDRIFASLGRPLVSAYTSFISVLKNADHHSHNPVVKKPSSPSAPLAVPETRGSSVTIRNLKPPSLHPHQDTQRTWSDNKVETLLKVSKNVSEAPKDYCVL